MSFVAKHGRAELELKHVVVEQGYAQRLSPCANRFLLWRLVEGDVERERAAFAFSAFDLYVAAEELCVLAGDG